MAYGKCPKCGANGISRERRPNGNDRCENGHEYPSKDAIKEPLKPLTISTEDLLELILGSEIDGMELMQKNFKYKSRWSTCYDIIVKIGDRFGHTMYEEAATEQQDVERFPCLGDEQSLMEMEPFQETVTKYRGKM